MSKQKMLILSFSEITSDARVLKQVKLFSEQFELTTCCYGARPDGAAHHIQIPDSEVYWDYPVKILALKQFQYAYWHTQAVVFAERALAGKTFDIILANDVDTAGVALKCRPRLGVHMDLHEYAPGQNEEQPRWKLINAPYMRWLCRKYVAKASSVTTVAQSIADRYEKEFGFSCGVVTNAPPFQKLSPHAVVNPIRLVYSGVALRNRGIENIIQAVKQFPDKFTFDLFLMPTDPIYLQELRIISEKTPSINIQPPKPYAELIQTLNNYDLGISVIPPVNTNYEYALPNKFFDYVQARLGLVIGPSPEMAKTLHQHNLGVIATSFSQSGLIETFKTIQTQQVSAWKANADAAAELLSAEHQVQVWQDAINAML